MLLKFYKKEVKEEEYQGLHFDRLPDTEFIHVGQNHEVGKLINKLCRSLSMRIRPLKEPYDFEDLLEGYGDPKNGTCWSARWDNWKNSGKEPEAWLGMENGALYITKSPYAGTEPEMMLPIFPHYEFDFSILQNTKEQNTMKALSKDFIDRMVNQNQDAVKLSAKMSVGKAANQVLTKTLSNTFPWYAKLFGKHREVVNNPFVRVATAEAVLAAVEQFYPENTKLKYVAEAMLQESMVDVATNSNALKSAIQELEALAGKLPGETK